jgi:hypothetical protein
MSTLHSYKSCSDIHAAFFITNRVAYTYNVSQCLYVCIGSSMEREVKYVAANLRTHVLLPLSHLWYLKFYVIVELH